MDTCIFLLPSSISSSFCSPRSANFYAPKYGVHATRSLVVIATARSTSGLQAPLHPKTEAARFLTTLLLDKRDNFQAEATKVLEDLEADKTQALARSDFSIASDQAFLHKRIAELKEVACQTAVEDVMYLMILSKFSEIGVYLIPSLSRCMYNGRVEIFPSRDGQLESIHSVEVLEMVREHLAAVVGWRSITNVKDSWTLTKVERLPLCQMYAASILYGYFLKSALLRHHLEQSLGHTHIQQDIGTVSETTHIPLREIGHLESMNISLSQIGGVQSSEVSLQNQGGLKGYVMRFDAKTMNICAKPWSKESVNLIRRHSNALFGDEDTCLLESDDTILTSFATLKRFCLEGIAFGSFLYDTEEYVNTVYKLGDNLVE